MLVAVAVHLLLLLLSFAIGGVVVAAVCCCCFDGILPLAVLLLLWYWSLDGVGDVAIGGSW